MKEQMRSSLVYPVCPVCPVYPVEGESQASLSSLFGLFGLFGPAAGRQWPVKKWQGGKSGKVKKGPHAEGDGTVIG